VFATTWPRFVGGGPDESAEALSELVPRPSHDQIEIVDPESTPCA
jgi:hypothetical protein